jgi:23S rRNA (cytidine1920-2'-O)/16S rRNA (cytidine1409-2'-O)-methyltransferase
MIKRRLDQRLVEADLVNSRSQAESYIKLGEVTVDGKVVTKPGLLVGETARLVVRVEQQYVSRAALKLSSVAKELGLSFKGTHVLDIGSSTGGFTDYALRHGARAVTAVEVGTEQLHLKLRGDPRITLYEKTDIRNVWLKQSKVKEADSLSVRLESPPDVMVADVSFISLREVLPHLILLSGDDTKIVVMLKPQFEATHQNIKHNGVIKNDKLRREIIKDFEAWAMRKFIILKKADSEVAGSKGNRERFYLLKPIAISPVRNIARK